MYRIAILGCENSHATNFLKLIEAGYYPDICVAGIYSNEPEAVEKLHDQFGVPVMQDYGDLAGQVDGVMITARHGDNHYRYAKPYMNDGIPMFIDKPIACSETEAVEFMREAKAKGIRLCGGSTCAALPSTLALADAVQNETLGEVRGGALACPLQSYSPYGGFYFYASHLVEIMLKIFGEEVREVLADHRGETFPFMAHYDNFNVMSTYMDHGKYYVASVYGALASQTEQLKLVSPDSFLHEMNDMLDLLQGKDMKKSYESFIRPVFVMNAILRSLESGKWEPLNPIEI